MKVCITKVTDFSGKDGREWTKIDFIAEDGETGTAMYKKGDYDVQVDTFSLGSVSEVEFNQRGRLVSVE